MQKKTKALLAFTLVASILSGCSASADMDVSEEAFVQETQSTDKSMTEEAVSEETTEDIVTSLPQIDIQNGSTIYLSRIYLWTKSVR